MRELCGLLLCALFWAACDVSLPYGTFRCAEDRGCPDDWSCRGGLCYPDHLDPSTNPGDASVDAQAPRDASSEPEPSTDAASPDAQRGTTPPDALPTRAS